MTDVKRPTAYRCPATVTAAWLPAGEKQCSLRTIHPSGLCWRHRDAR